MAASWRCGRSFTVHSGPLTPGNIRHCGKHGGQITPLTPGQAAFALTNLPITETLTTNLANQAAALADAVRDTLATPPGGPHDQPWSETGALRASIGVSTDALSARVGSSDPAATPQELGTAAIQPRPFFAPAAASLAEPLARAIGQTLADLIARRLT